MQYRDQWLQPDFYNRVQHNKLRRALWHDYRMPCIYLITMTKRESAEVPLFSSLVSKENGEIDVKFSWSGWAVYNALNRFAKEYGFIKLGRYVIMPDHVHAIIQVLEETEKPLGHYVNKLKAIATMCFRSKSQVKTPSGESVFGPGFNDRILIHEGQLSNWNNYVIDNPRRLWLRIKHPAYFCRSYLFAKESPSYIWDINAGKTTSDILPHQFPTFGNAQLLRYPQRTTVRFSRKFSEQEWCKKREEVLMVAKNGGVLVTPAVHAEEKRLLKEGLLLGARVIKVIAYGYPPKEKPQGEDFHHCAEGRMLLFALNKYDPGIRRDVVNRILCEKMNACAQWIAETVF